MEQVKINGECIKLGQFLKLSRIVDTGGQAKFFILDGRVKVNGLVVTQRGKKIYPGDIIEIDGAGKFQVTK